MCGKVATLEDLRAVFTKHYAYHRHSGGETAYQQRGTEGKVKLQYSGRVLFELLQNAIDRATRHVSARIVELAGGDHALLVTNDGTPLMADPDYDYAEPPEARDERRSDFNALCSVNTSNKSPNDSVGNKGVGFRSVFGLSRYVQVWSRLANRRDGWWGLELHDGLTAEIWRERLADSPAVRQGHRRILHDETIQLTSNQRRPSFHFPLPLWSAAAPDYIEDPKRVATAVVVRFDQEERDALEQAFDQVEKSHLHFVGLRPNKRGLKVSLARGDTPVSRPTWIDGAAEAENRLLVAWRSAALHPLAKKAKHDLEEPGAAVYWCAPGRCESAAGRIYSYLPTTMEAGLPVDVHADFQLREDRTGLRLDDEKVGAYNGALMEVAAELHVFAALTVLGACTGDDLMEQIPWKHISPDEVEVHADLARHRRRHDFWKFLTPGGHTAIDDHLERLLFSGRKRHNTGRYRRWATIAATFFDDASPRPVACFHDFWRACATWLDRNENGWRGESHAHWQNWAATMCDAMYDAGAYVIPIVNSADDNGELVPAVRLPERREQHDTTASERRVFWRRAQDEALEFMLPSALLDAEQSVTAFAFPAGFAGNRKRPTGLSSFDRWTVLSQLRQLPNTFEEDAAGWPPEPLADESTLAEKKQLELLHFGWKLFSAEFANKLAPSQQPERFAMGWRAFRERHSSGQRSAGRAVATLFLPTRNGKWEPARQLSIARVDTDRLARVIPGEELEAYLAFLGVASSTAADEPALTLLESGVDSLVKPVDVPPALVQAGRGGGQLRLGLDLDRPHPNLHSALSRMWSVWLAAIVDEERRSTKAEGENSIIDVRRPLCASSWMPADGEIVSPPDYVADLTEEPDTTGIASSRRVAPRDVVLTSPKGGGTWRRLLWTCNRENEFGTIVAALGAVGGINAEHLGKQQASAALRILEQLPADLERLTADSLSRPALIQLFQRLLDAIAREAPEETRCRLLMFEGRAKGASLSERHLRWSTADERAWIAKDPGHRELMRRFFGDLPLVTATLGPEVVERLESLRHRGVDVDGQVQLPDSRTADDGRAAVIGERLGAIIPKLLALAEASRIDGVDVTQATERWAQHSFVYVDDAWVEYRATHQGRELGRQPWRRHQYDDAFFVETDDAYLIVFDNDPDSDNRLPPLGEFGEPLAKLLLSNRKFGPLFAQALGAYGHHEDGERLDALLAKQGAESLVGSYERHFTELDHEQAARLVRQTRACLQTIGFDLSDPSMDAQALRSLRKRHIISTGTKLENTTETQLQAALDDIDLEAHLRAYRPRFSCRFEHQQAWLDWKKSTGVGEKLLEYGRYLLTEGGPSDVPTGEAPAIEKLGEQLRAFIHQRARRLGFRSPTAAQDWLNSLADTPLDFHPDELVGHMHRFSPNYRKVSAAPQYASKVGWEGSTAGSAAPSGREAAPYSPERAMKDAVARGRIGTQAEEALLGWACRQTHEVLCRAGEAGWKTLLSAVPRGGRTEELLARAQARWVEHSAPSALANGLHMAQVWGSAGYDVLGLTMSDETPEVVRYEVKGLPADAECVRVFVSANEFATFRRTRLNGDIFTDDPRYRGDWRLVGVHPSGRALDLTERLEPLLDDTDALLAPIHSQGVDFDGLIVRIKRASDGQPDQVAAEAQAEAT